MPYARNGRQRLYYRVEGSGPPLLLHHGFSMCLEDWVEQGYTTALRERCRLILFDARGHGRSDKPHDPRAYGHKALVDDVLAVLDALALDRVWFYGFSLGGVVGFHLARYALERVRAFIFAGAGLKEADSYPELDTVDTGHNAGWLRLLAGGSQVLPDLWRTYAPISAARAARLAANDVEALGALLTMHRCGYRDVLPGIDVPCLLYAGEMGAYPSAARAAALLPKARLVCLPRLNHCQVWARTDLALPLVEAFLDSLPGDTQTSPTQFVSPIRRT